MERKRAVSHGVTQKRKWEKIVEPLLKYCRFPFTDFSFPLDFYYQLEKMIEKGNAIHLNIPFTLTGMQDNLLETKFSDLEDEIGAVVFTPMINKNKFESIVERQSKIAINMLKNRKQIYEEILQQKQENINAKNLWFPFVVMKEKQGRWEAPQYSTSIKNIDQFKKLATIDSYQIAQNYIFNKNNSISITRFFYFPEKIDSVAYKIENEESPFSQKMSKMLWKVKEDRQYSCSHVKIMYQNKSFFHQTLNLISCIEKYTKKKVTKIVTDWTIDITTNKYYLIDMKELRLSDPPPKFRIRKSLKELLATVTCPMCQQTYNPSEITKSLTSKLIIDFYQNLRNRGVSLSFKVNCNWKKKSDINQVCDLCYNLVVQEAELQEMARKMAILCNVEGLRESKETNKDNEIKIGFNNIPFQKQALKFDWLYQWRIFFFLEDIRDFDRITSAPQFESQPDLFYLNMKIHETTTSFSFKKGDNPLLKAIKIQYIFSETEEISDFLQTSEIQVQISLKPGWNRPISEGCLRGVYEKQFKKQQFSQRKYKQILMFSENSTYCALGMYIGVYCDGRREIPPEMKLRKTENIYKSESDKVDTSNLPAEWMEIIDPVYCESNQAGRSQSEISNPIKSQVPRKQCQIEEKLMERRQRPRLVL